MSQTVRGTTAKEERDNECERGGVRKSRRVRV